jgi:diadenylate cyclase
MHLNVLAAMAELLNDDAFRRALVKADHVCAIKPLLVERAGQQPRLRPQSLTIPRRSIAVARHAVGLAESLSAQALLLAMDQGQSVPWEPLKSWPGRLLLVASKNSDEGILDRADTHLFDIPHATLSRMDRANLGLLLAAANGLVDHEREVVCITGSRGQALDSITVTRPAAHFRAVFPGQEGHATSNIPPAVILRVLSLAIELASEGREAHPIGVMFVIGDTRQVVRHTQQLVLNPFHGFARRLRNVLDPSLAETVKEFALLDGAFIVEADGAIRSAGTYLNPKSHVADLPGGLGARHRAAAAITAETRAMAVTVSQSTGTVTLFQGGGVVLALERATLTRW